MMMREPNENELAHVRTLEQAIAQHVQDINRAKVEIPEPKQRRAYISQQIDAAISCGQQIGEIMGQRYALRVLVEEHCKIIPED